MDLGETRGLDYHTGLTFEGFVPGLGEALFSGGRYDGLTTRYGFDAPATGFTCNLLSIIQALELQGDMQEQQRDLLVLNSAEDRREALEVSRELRQRGYVVAHGGSKRDLERSLRYAADTGIRSVLVIGTDQINYLLIDAVHKTEQNLTQTQLLQMFSARD
jgi:ATP phosphoribosyltransferase regulatory subunit